MFNYTDGAEKWKTALTKMIEKSHAMFYPEDKGSIMVEPCEQPDLCDADQESFKAYLGRWYGTAMQMAPFTIDLIMPKLQQSAIRAAQTCEGPSQHNGGNHQCGMKWYVDGYDGKYGVGPQMTALNVISVLNAPRVPAPYTSKTGGTSQGDPGLGNGNQADTLPIYGDDITTADKAGGAIVTLIVGVLMLGGTWWIIMT